MRYILSFKYESSIFVISINPNLGVGKRKIKEWKKMELNVPQPMLYPKMRPVNL